MTYSETLNIFFNTKSSYLYFVNEAMQCKCLIFELMGHKIFSSTTLGYPLLGSRRGFRPQWRVTEHDSTSCGSVFSGLVMATRDHSAGTHRHAAHWNIVPKHWLGAHDQHLHETQSGS